MTFLLAQIFGIIALILVAISYFINKKSTFLIFQVIADFFYALAYLVVDAWSAGVITLISLVRCIYLYIADKKNFKNNVPFLMIFVALFAVTTIFFWKTSFDFIPLITSTLFTFGYEIKNMQVMRYVLLIPNALLVIYNILITTYASAVLDFMEIVAILAAIIKFYLNNKKNRETKIFSNYNSLND